MTAHSQVIEFSAVGGVETCVELPVPPRGRLNRLIIKQLSGVAVGAPFKVYDRRGACLNANDFEVKSGSVVAVTAGSGGLAQVETAEAHGLNWNEYVHIKGCSIAAYNKKHLVAAVIDETNFLSDVLYTADGAGNLWQSDPFMPIYDPVMHTVYADSVTSGTVFQALSLSTPYANADNQNIHIRTRRSSLWLAITPAGTGAKTWQLAVTATADSLV